MLTVLRHALHLALLLSLANASAYAAMQVQKGSPPAQEPAPAAPAPAPAPAAPRRTTLPAGSVIFVRGDQVVAEISGTVKPGERIVVLDASLRRRGLALVSKPLEGGTYLLTPEGSYSISEGDRLRAENEAEAAARVLEKNSPEAYREFLEFFPSSAYRPRIARELFRLAMASDFPAEDGSILEGRLRLAESVGREISLSGAQIVLDRYLLPATDAEGGFRIEGLPIVSEAATLGVKIKDPRFLLSSEVDVKLPPGKSAKLSVEVPVKVTPTVLVGKVVDENGNAVPGAEIWTSPYTAETLSGDDGTFRISRRKAPAEGAQELRDQPLFGGDFEVYARRKGYGVERVSVSAESYRENRVPDLRLPAQDPRRESLPDLGSDLRASIWGRP